MDDVFAVQIDRQRTMEETLSDNMLSAIFVVLLSVQVRRFSSEIALFDSQCGRVDSAIKVVLFLVQRGCNYQYPPR